MKPTMGWFTTLSTPLAGLVVIERRRREDSRGFFGRLFCADELRAVGFGRPIAQINQTLTARRGSVRGLHFQHPPHAEDKFVSCLRGEIFDVAVDLRRDSPTFLQWHGEILSAANARSLLIPQGFAHGFQTLQDDCELLYLHSAPYAAAAEGALNIRDPSLRIEWPLPLADVSERDAGHAFVASDFRGIELTR
jgi:dTDP-4-dehydrorhamnose 3,5-epimerase